MTGRAFDYVQYEFEKWVKARDVVLIGGKDNFDTEILNRDNWPEYTVYARVNSHVERQGGPCDVLYHTVIGDPPLRPELLEEPQYAFLNLVDGDYEAGERHIPYWAQIMQEGNLPYGWPRTKSGCEVGFFAQGEWLADNPYGAQYEWLNELHKQYKTKLFTGMVALAHLTQFKPKTVNVFGMDLYVEQTGAERKSMVGSHGMEGNFAFAQDCLQMSNVKYDLPLMNSLTKYTNADLH